MRHLIVSLPTNLKGKSPKMAGLRKYTLKNDTYPIMVTMSTAGIRSYPMSSKQTANY